MGRGWVAGGGIFMKKTQIMTGRARYDLPGALDIARGAIFHARDYFLKILRIIHCFMFYFNIYNWVSRFKTMQTVTTMSRPPPRAGQP